MNPSEPPTGRPAIRSGVQCGDADRPVPHRSVRIDVVSDVVCPWCYVGKRRLEAALAARPDGHLFEVAYHPYELNPGATASVPVPEALRHKYGERAEGMMRRVVKAAADEGITMDFATALRGNTFDAHRLIVHAGHHGRQGETVERLMAAHFTDGRDIADHGTLADVAAEAGLDHAEALAMLTSGEGTAQVREEIEAAQTMGVSTVPTYIIERRWVVQGAQRAAVFTAALNQAAAEGSPENSGR